MPDDTALPPAIGATENALRPLLVHALEPTAIGTYERWVVLNAASKGAPTTVWSAAVADTLKLQTAAVEAVAARLASDGLLDSAGLPTTTGQRELTKARSHVAATTARLTEGLSEEDQAVTRRTLAFVRQRAEELAAS